MKKYTYILLFLLFVSTSDLRAFEPKVSYSKEPLPLFNISSKKLAEIEQNNPNDPTLLEMKKISRENIKQLPDELDFGDYPLNIDDNFDIIPKYKIYNFVFESMIINAGLETNQTLDSISLFPAPSQLGIYEEDIIFYWEEIEPNTEKLLRFKKTIKIKANIIDNYVKQENKSNSIVGFSNINNDIKEIWYENKPSTKIENNDVLTETGRFIIVEGAVYVK